MQLEEMTCLQVFNALTYAMQTKTFERDLPFVVFIEDYLEEPDETPDTTLVR